MKTQTPMVHGSRKKSKGNRASSTRGIDKGIVATIKQKTYCKRNRSWKQPDYATVMASIGKKKGK